MTVDFAGPMDIVALSAVPVDHPIEGARRSRLMVIEFAGSDAIDRHGVETILALRSKFGEPQKDLTDPDRYIDLSYYTAARG